MKKITDPRRFISLFENDPFLAQYEMEIKRVAGARSQTEKRSSEALKEDIAALTFSAIRHIVNSDRILNQKIIKLPEDRLEEMLNDEEAMRYMAHEVAKELSHRRASGDLRRFPLRQVIHALNGAELGHKPTTDITNANTNSVRLYKTHLSEDAVKAVEAAIAVYASDDKQEDLRSYYTVRTSATIPDKGAERAILRTAVRLFEDDWARSDRQGFNSVSAELAAIKQERLPRGGNGSSPATSLTG